LIIVRTDQQVINCQWRVNYETGTTNYSLMLIKQKRSMWHSLKILFSHKLQKIDIIW